LVDRKVFKMIGPYVYIKEYNWGNVIEMNKIINAITLTSLMDCIKNAEDRTKKSEAYKKEYSEIIEVFIKNLDSEINERVR